MGATRLVAGLFIAGAPLAAQDSTTAGPGRRSAAGATSAVRLLVEFKPPAQGVRRDETLTRGGPRARAIVPHPRIDTLVAQTIRDTPVVAVCAGGQPDSAWLRVRVGDVMNDVMVALRPGLNRLSLGAAKVAIGDGDVAEWSLATRSGTLLLQEFIQRRFARIAPTVKALATNGIWYDALDRFAREAQRGVPLARERLDAFVSSVGAAPCGSGDEP